MNEWLADTVREAGLLAREYLSRGFAVKYKVDGSPVTSADLHIDRFLRERIHVKYPEDCVLTEESQDNPQRLSVQRVWLVDPIDGTAAFAAKRPEFGILVALCVEGEAVESVAHFPLMEITLWAGRGHGVMVNGRPVRVSAVSGDNVKVSAAGGRFESLHTAPGRHINNTLALFRVITGEIEGSVVACGSGAGEHDYAWASCALEAAGGRLTDGDGNALRYNKPIRTMPPVIIGSNGAIHVSLLEQAAAL